MTKCTLRPVEGAFDSLRGSQTMQAFAEQLGVDQSTLSRVIAGKSEPGPRFIAKTLLRLAVEFNDLYEPVELAEV